MKYCKYCGQENAVEALYCQECGRMMVQNGVDDSAAQKYGDDPSYCREYVNVKYCVYCGQVNGDEALYCQDCGRMIAQNDVDDAASQKHDSAETEQKTGSFTRKSKAVIAALSAAIFFVCIFVSVFALVDKDAIFAPAEVNFKSEAEMKEYLSDGIQWVMIEQNGKRVDNISGDAAVNYRFINISASEDGTVKVYEEVITLYPDYEQSNFEHRLQLVYEQVNAIESLDDYVVDGYYSDFNYELLSDFDNGELDSFTTFKLLCKLLNIDGYSEGYYAVGYLNPSTGEILDQSNGECIVQMCKGNTLKFNGKVYYHINHEKVKAYCIQLHEDYDEAFDSFLVWLQEEENRAAREAAEAKRQKFLDSYSYAATAKEVQYAPYSYLGDAFILEGTAKLDDYFNYDYRGLEMLYFCIAVTPYGGGYSDTWYIYADRNRYVGLYNELLSGGSVDVIFVSEGYYPDALTHRMATLTAYYLESE